MSLRDGAGEDVEVLEAPVGRAPPPVYATPDGELDLVSGQIIRDLDRQADVVPDGLLLCQM
jgi:streptogramin lyase